MSFASLTDFLAMGGHAPYVWSAYGIGLVVILVNVLSPGIARRRFFEIEGERERRAAVRAEQE